MSDYFQKHRRDWIEESLRVYGFINREHLVRRFGLSVPQASKDLQAAARQNSLIVYNSSLKRYEMHGVNPVGESPK